jgi:Zn finger protein HypA/HybF involved in hydrogenase expression
MSDDTLEEDWESRVAEVFPQCPLCGSKSLRFDIEYGSVQDYIYCLGCKAKWQINWKGEDFKIESITLVEVSDVEKSALKGESHSPEYWQKMALQTKEEEQPNAKKNEVIVEKEVIKVRCPYCGELYDESLDACPNCGGKR